MAHHKRGLQSVMQTEVREVMERRVRKIKGETKKRGRGKGTQGEDQSGIE